MRRRDIAVLLDFSYWADRHLLDVAEKLMVRGV
jgi:hypothetical protein